jgi:hypothetical protein
MLRLFHRFLHCTDERFDRPNRAQSVQTTAFLGMLEAQFQGLTATIPATAAFLQPCRAVSQ